MVHLVHVRADALRNRTRILQAARQLVAEQGADVSMDAIAARAQVAVGTLYRHHPTKAHLITAVIEDSAERIAELSERAASAVGAGAAPAAELGSLFRAVAGHAADDRALKAAAALLGTPVPADPAEYPAGSAARRAAQAIEVVLEAARRDGTVRADLGITDLIVLLAGVPDEARARQRYVEIVLNGIAPR
jgi:AcrR family transcriptional regulator